MSNKNLDIALRIKADLKQALTQLDNLETGLKQTDSAARKAGGGIRSTADSTERFRKEASQLPALLRTIAGLMATAFSVNQIAQAAETYGVIRNRLALVTEGSQELANAQDAVFQSAQTSRQPLAATAELYQRIATNAKELKLSAAGVAGVVDTVNKTLAISGTTGASSEAALIQLGQAFASNTLRGEELNSVLEQAPALAKALATGLGVTVGQLKKLGEEGKLSAQNVIQALQSQSGAVEEQFKKITITGGQALTVLGNSLIKVVGELDTATGSSIGFGNTIMDLAAWLDSGQLTQGLITSLNIWSGVFAAMSQDIESLGGDLDGVAYAGDETAKFLIQAFQQMPANLRSAIQIATVEILAIFDKTLAYASYVADNVKAVFTDSTQDEALAGVEKRFQEIDRLREESIVSIMQERDAILKNAEAGKQAYAQEKAAREAARAQREKDIAKLNDAAKSKAVSFGVDPQQQKAAEDYVKNLEKQTLQLTASRAAITDYENAEKKLTGTLLQRALAAQKAKAEVEDKAAIESLQVQLLRAQGNENAAAEQEFKQRYKKFLDNLSGETKEKGKEIVDNLLDLTRLNNNLDKAKTSFSRTLSEISRQEESINIQREAGLISEYEARQRIYELHQAQAQKLEEMRPTLEALSRMPDEVGRTATAALAQLDNEMLRLQTTMTQLQSTLREGLEQGLTDAIMGLADGTMTLRDAISAVANSVAQALAQMAAQALAQQAVGALFGGGNKDSGESMKQAALAMDSSAVIWTGVATRIQLAAQQLAAANAAGGVSSAAGAAGGASGGGGYAGLISTFASVFAATGGQVIGPGTSTSDSIPAMLSNKEFVTQAARVVEPGALSFLHDFNQRGMRALADWAPVRHSTGGLAGFPAPAAPSPGLRTELASPGADRGAEGSGGVTNRILNIIDPEVMDDHLMSASGDRIFVNWMKKNTALVQRIAGSRS